MKKRAINFVLAAGALTAGLAAGAPALAAGPDGPPPPHGHILVLGVEVDAAGEWADFRRCVDIADNQPLPLHAHHAHLHRGRAGDALRGAGNWPVPTAPLTPWSNCEEFIEMVFAPQP